MGILGIALKKEKQNNRLSPTDSAGTYLSELKTGDRGTVTALHGCVDFREKMLSLGIVPGINFTVLNGGSGQPFLLRIGDTRLMLGKGMANKVIVSVQRRG